MLCYAVISVHIASSFCFIPLLIYIYMYMYVFIHVFLHSLRSAWITVVPAFFKDHPFSQNNMALKLNVLLKWRYSYTDTIRVVSLMASLKIEGIVNGRVLHHRDHGISTWRLWALSIVYMCLQYLLLLLYRWSCTYSSRLLKSWPHTITPGHSTVGQGVTV